MSFEVPRVHLAIDSQFGNIELVQIVVEEALKKLELDEETAHSIGLAVREAVANAIKHGNEEDPSKRVEIECGVEKGVVVICVSDQGKGFDPERVADPLTQPNIMKPNGRGIFFMKNFMDEIDYTFGADGGTVVTLKKRLTASLTESDHRENK